MKSILLSFIVSIVCCTIGLSQENESPSTEKKWTIEDYKNFNSYLDGLSIDSYPTLKNEKTKALFLKVIATDYKGFLRDETISLDEKGPYMMKCQNHIREILGNYLVAFMKEKVYGIELMYLQGVSIDISAEMIPIIKELMKTFDKNDETYQIRMNGLKRMKLGLKQQLQAALIIIKDVENSSDDERIILTEYFSNAAVEILNFLEAEERNEIISEIQKHFLVEPNAKVKSLLSALVSKIKTN